jgi:hypothetical protein
MVDDVMSVEDTKDLIKFPVERTGHPARGGASIRDVMALRLRAWFGSLANRLGLPGAIQPVDIEDRVTGQRLAVTVGTMLVRVTVNGRDFYFNRITGRFDGTGSGYAG